MQNDGTKELKKGERDFFTCKDDNSTYGPAVRNVKESARHIDDAVHLADLGLLRSQVRESQSLDALLGRLAGNSKGLRCRG